MIIAVTEFSIEKYSSGKEEIIDAYTDLYNTELISDITIRHQLEKYDELSEDEEDTEFNMYAWNDAVGKAKVEPPQMVEKLVPVFIICLE